MKSHFVVIVNFSCFKSCILQRHLKETLQKTTGPIRPIGPSSKSSAKAQHDAYGNGQCSPGALDTKEFRHDVDTWPRDVPETDPTWKLILRCAFLVEGIRKMIWFQFSTWILYRSRWQQLQSQKDLSLRKSLPLPLPKTSENQRSQWEIPELNGHFNRNIIELVGFVQQVASPNPKDPKGQRYRCEPDNTANFLKRGKPAPNSDRIHRKKVRPRPSQSLLMTFDLVN